MVSPNYQPVIIGKSITYENQLYSIFPIKGYLSEDGIAHKSSVSFTSQITDFIKGKFCLFIKTNNRNY